jgi:hypothetical protein
MLTALAVFGAGMLAGLAVVYILRPAVGMDERGGIAAVVGFDPVTEAEAILRGQR